MIYNSYYSVYVSKDGFIFKIKSDKLTLCNMVPDRDGYYRVSVSRMSQYAKEHKSRHCVHVHKIIAHTFLGEQQNDTVIDHKDRNRQNNTIENLRYITVKENAQNRKDMTGENNPMFGKNAWAISCTRKTPEEIEVTRKTKSEKMKKFWSENPEALKQMSEKVATKRRGIPKTEFGLLFKEKYGLSVIMDCDVNLYRRQYAYWKRTGKLKD